MAKAKRIMAAMSVIGVLTLTNCGVNPFDLSLLTNNAFANIMVAFLRNLGAPVGMDKRQEGNNPAQTMAKMSARALQKVAAGQEFRVLSLAEAEDSLTSWFTAEYVDDNREQLLQEGDSILFAKVENDTDNYEVKSGNTIINLGNQGISNQENFRFWAFKGRQRKISIAGKGDKVGEEGDMLGLVFIPSIDRRIIWKAKVTKAMNGIDSASREYNVGDTASAILDPLIQEGNDYVQYGTLNYWDKSENKERMGIEIKIFHNNTIGLAEENWADNKAETHFPLEDETNPAQGEKTYYIVAMHYGEHNPSADDPYEYREEGIVYRSRSCSDPDLEEAQCALRDGYDYTGKYIAYEKPRGNAEGSVTFYDEDGDVIDEQTVKKDAAGGTDQVN